MFITVRYLGIVVHSSELKEDVEYTVGRSRKSDIVLDISMMSRHQGKIYSLNGEWWFDVKGSKVKIEPLKPLVMRDQLEIVLSAELPEENTKSSTVDNIRTVLTASQRKINTINFSAAFLAVISIVGGFGGYRYFKANQPMDAKTLLPFVRSKIVEFELPRKAKIVGDLRKYAKFEDKDFSDTLGFCTGFIMAKNVVLTANHCIQGSGIADPVGEFTIKTNDGKKHKVKRVLGFNAKRDYAFLEMEGMESYGSLEFAASYTIGNKVFTVGNAHGQGIAIREGLLANETPDRNDPKVKFIRYSAAASPGNSGGPLVDEYGRVVSLVFAKTNSGENYNLGTTTGDLKSGFAKFVKDRKVKDVETNTKDLLIYYAPQLLSSLSYPSQANWYENPEYSEPLSEITFNVSVPAVPEKFFSEATHEANKATKKVYDKIIALMKKDGKESSNWSSWVDENIRVVVPSQFESSYYKVKLNKELTQVIESTAFIKPPSDYYKKSFSESFKKGNYSFRPTEHSGEIVMKEGKKGEKHSNFKSGELYFSSADKESKKSISSYAYRPGLEVRKNYKLNGASWDEKRRFPKNLMFKRLVGKEGVLASSSSTYVRPNSHKEFTVKSFSEDMVSTQITDRMGREWELNYFTVFNMHIEHYCLPSIQGAACLVKTRNRDDLVLTDVVRQNFVDYELSNYLLKPEFGRMDATMDYVAKGYASSNPMMNDFEVKPTKSGGLQVVLKSVGVEFEIPKSEKPSSIRLNGGFLAAKNKWVALSFDTVHKEGKKSHICGRGVELKKSPSSSVLSRERENVKSYRKYYKNMKHGFYSKDFSSRKLAKDFSAFGYCWAMTEKEKGKEFVKVRLGKLKPRKVKFKLHEKEIIAH